MPSTALGHVHLWAASLALLLGAFQLVRLRRDALHRRVGYAYVTALGVSDLTALTVYEFTGGFNVFHALALYSLVCLGLALRPMLTTPRPFQWRRVHYLWIAWSYAGLSAAAATEFLVRVAHMEGWLASVVGTLPVIGIGAFLIGRFAPPRRIEPAAAPGGVSG
ncbi:MAG TPA: DUF2306 domain-containing protein [Gemmatimonadales bacterium]|nr:DUF2306 domain-containing protein [Gemmatimonadales bacterium]